MKKKIFNNLQLGKKFSLENEYFNKYVGKIKHNSYIYDGEFIDMGIVEDYERLQEKL